MGAPPAGVYLTGPDAAFDPAARAEYDELCADIRLSCTYGMLLCLSREQRIVYLLGDLLRFTDAEGGRGVSQRPAVHSARAGVGRTGTGAAHLLAAR